MTLSSDQRRRMSMGYERFLTSFVEGADDNAGDMEGHIQTSKERLLLEQKRKTVHELKTLGKVKIITEPDFDNRFHEMMFHFGESKAYSIFILFIILLNTCFLVALTWQEVSVRIGGYKTQQILQVKVHSHWRVRACGPALRVPYCGPAPNVHTTLGKLWPLNFLIKTMTKKFSIT